MIVDTIGRMKRGWFVGNFEPSLIKTDDVECAVKRYNAGDYEGQHYHRIATEITVVVSGIVEMDGIEYHADDIILLEPGDVTDFRAITDAVCCVVKHPGACEDKFVVGGTIT